jgi:hypothetical protein
VTRLTPIALILTALTSTSALAEHPGPNFNYLAASYGWTQNDEPDDTLNAVQFALSTHVVDAWFVQLSVYDANNDFQIQNVDVTNDTRAYNFGIGYEHDLNEHASLFYAISVTEVDSNLFINDKSDEVYIADDTSYSGTIGYALRQHDWEYTIAAQYAKSENNSDSATNVTGEVKYHINHHWGVSLAVSAGDDTKSLSGVVYYHF